MSLNFRLTDDQYNKISPLHPNKGGGRAVGKTGGGLNSRPHPVCDGQGRPVH